MKLLWLILIFKSSWYALPDGAILESKIVDSPKSAAIILWDKNKSVEQYSWYEAKLYEVSTSTVKEIPIPTLEFK